MLNGYKYMTHTLYEALLVHGIRTRLAPDEGVPVCTMHALVADGAVVLWARRAALFHRLGLFRGGSSLPSCTCICVANALVDNRVGCRRCMREYFLEFGGEKCSVR